MSTNWWQYQAVGDFGQTFSWATNPVQGEDIETPFNTPITAIFPGTVTSTYYDQGGGQVIIQADDPTSLRGIPYYWFAHLDQIFVTQGQHVDPGTQLGLSGGQNVGGQHPAAPNYSSGPHTEFGEAKSNQIPYTLATITPDLNPDWILASLQGVQIPSRNPFGSSSTSRSALTSTACNCKAPDTIVTIDGEQYCKHDNGNGTASYKSCQVGGGGPTPLDNIISGVQNLIPWFSNPVRIIKLFAGSILLLGALFLFAFPSSPIAQGIKTVSGKVGLK
jgi:Peptidase family M23